MADLQSAPAATQAVAISNASEITPTVLASCLALLTRNSPDLVLLVERWDGLPEAVRAGIVAMVKATSVGRRPNDETTKLAKAKRL